MPLPSGFRVGPYEVVAPLGAGGMGEVYRARDERLGRDVAVKILPDDVARDPDRLARFEREARVLASLSHAGIASLYGLEDVDGGRALIMELVEGPTLAERIETGPIPPDEVLPIARQIAEALEYAHDRAIVHRDLKPANVKLRPDGTVKVLDFGLARALDAERAPQADSLTRSPTLTQRMTNAGMILGTAAYMSPEQARGREADRRADVWAFGAVVFEMLTGRRLFEGETLSDTLASIMRDEPGWASLPPGLSARWTALLRRCLTKDPRRRLQAIGEARVALEDLAAHPEDPDSGSNAVAASPPATRARRAAALAPWILAAGALAVLAAFLWLSKPGALPPATELSIVAANGQRIGLDNTYQPIAIAPDGATLAYTVRIDGRLRLRLRRLDTRQDVELPATDGARNLFFSRDSQWIGFFDSRRMFKVSVHGGTPIALADSLQDRLGAWLDDGTIVFTRDTTEPLYRIPESGGTSEAITTLDTAKRERTHRFPSALAGGPWVVFTVQTVDSPGGYDDAAIDAVNVKTRERRHLYKGARRAAWAPGGHLLLARGSDLYATPIDPRDPKIAGDPVPVLSGVSGETSAGASYFSIADDGTIAWMPGGEIESTREVGWLDRQSRWTPTPIAPGPYQSVMISPDRGRVLILAGAGGGSADLWLADLRTGSMTRLTRDNTAGSAVWLPDGVRIVYSRSEPSGGDSVVVRRLDGAGGERVITTAPNPVFVSSVSSDGAWVVFSDYGSRRGRMHLAALDGSSPPKELPAQGQGNEQAGRISPDGRWLAYVSNKTGREEAYVRPFGAGDGIWQLSTGGGGGIRWGRDSHEIFLVDGERLTSVPLAAQADSLTIGQPEVIFEAPPSPTEATFRDYEYDPATDRFLFTRSPRGIGERREIAISLRWTSRLDEKMRAGQSAAR